MLEDEKRCPVCGGKAEEGFVLDFTQSGQVASRWVSGKPEKMRSGVAAFSDRPNFQIGAFRCESCGHLEFYAIDEPSFKAGS